MIGGSVTFFWISGLFDGFVPVYRSFEGEKSNNLLSQAFLSSLVLGFISGAAIFLIGSVAYPELSSGSIVAFSIFMAFNCPAYTLQYYFLVSDRPVSLFLYGFFDYLLYFLIVVVILALGYTLVVAIGGLAVLAGIKFLLTAVLLRERLFPLKFRREAMTLLWNAATPLALAALLSGSAVYVDKYLVSNFFREIPDAFAVFSYGSKELPLALLLANATSVVASGTIASSLKKGKSTEGYQSLKKSSDRLLLFLAPLTLLFLIFSDYLYAIAFGEGFAASALIFDVYLLLLIPRLLFPQAVLRGHLKTRIMTWSAGIELVLNVALSLILMQFWGLQGIAMATVLAFMCEKLVLVWYLKTKLGISMAAYTRLLSWGGISLALIAAYLIKVMVFSGA